MSLVLALMASILTLTVVGAEPAAAADTIVRTADEIVVTSPRLHDLEVHATVTFRIKSDGYMYLQIDAHNTARTRKFVNASGSVLSGGLRFQVDRNYRSRIEVGEWVTWYANAWSFDLEANWERVVNDPNLTTHLSMDAFRIQG